MFSVRGLAVREDQKDFLDSALGIIARGYIYRASRARVLGIAHGGEVSVLETNKVREFAGDQSMGAYLIQAALPEGVNEWERVDIEIRDDKDAFGMATIFA